MLNPLEVVHRIAEDIVAFATNIPDFRKLTNGELLSYHKKLFTLDDLIWRQGQVQNLLELHNSYLTGYVKSILARRFGQDKVLDYFQILTTSIYKTRTELEEEAFVRLYLKTKNLSARGAEFTKLLQKHQQQFTWMAYGFAGPALTLNDFKQKLNQARRNPIFIKDIIARHKEKQKILRQQKRIVSQLPGRDRRFVVMLRKIMEAKAERVDAHSLTYFIADQLRAELARRIDVNVNQIRTVLPQDTAGLFNGLNKKQLNKEYQFVLYHLRPGRKMRKVAGTLARKKLKSLLATVPKLKDVSELKGEIAFPGKVRGRVRVVLEAKEFPQFKKGEILVTRITDPSYLPIMKKAAAIVTEVGGITSHAAIVSRELKVPCIVGTKVAVQALKTGQLVEVDANQGIVKKL